MVSLDKKYNVLIIGGGPAGIWAANLAHIKGLKPVLIEQNKMLGGQPSYLYSHKKIYDYPGFYGITAHDLIEKFIVQFKQNKILTLLNTSIQNITHKNSYIIKLNNGKNITVQYIIIATGAGLFSPSKLDIPGANNKNVSYVIGQKQDYKNKHVVILGGGDSSVDWANELAEWKICKSITIVHRRDEFRAHGDNVKKLKTNKINILLNYIPKNIKKNILTITSNQNNNDKQIKFDKLIVQYGQSMKQNITNLFPNIKTINNNRIEVSSNQQTNIKNVLAVGDVCFYKDKPSSLICAHGEAAVAIRSIINDLRQYDKK